MELSTVARTARPKLICGLLGERTYAPVLNADGGYLVYRSVTVPRPASPIVSWMRLEGRSL
jgi:hypothetical protein